MRRSVALGVMHGYAFGKKGATTFNCDNANALSNDFIGYCLANLRAKALESFEKLVKQVQQTGPRLCRK
jgi:hypothetical protein